MITDATLVRVHVISHMHDLSLLELDPALSGVPQSELLLFQVGLALNLLGDHSVASVLAGRAVAGPRTAWSPEPASLLYIERSSLDHAGPRGASGLPLESLASAGRGPA